ncbi:MAG: AAA domain-containing protein, partial [Acidimicrobiales bacterium]
MLQGTGKSRTVGAILDGYVIDAVDQRQRARILVTAATWKAIDNILVPFMSRQPGVPTFRPRSGAGLPPTGQLAAVDLNVDDKDDLEDLVTALGDAVGPVVVACTPQQARKVVEAACGSAAGELFDVIVVDEAGQIDVGLALLSLAGLAEAGQVVIAGDPLQLPPIVAAEPPEHLAWMVGPLYSYFADGYQVTPHTLLTNYRSNAEIVELSKLAETARIHGVRVAGLGGDDRMAGQARMP